MSKTFEVEISETISISDNLCVDLIEKIKLSQKIPDGSKDAISDYISGSFNESWSTLEELASIIPPIELSEYWGVVLEIIELLI